MNSGEPSTAPSPPGLSTSAVHVWTLALCPLLERLPAAPELLSVDEVNRWNRFRFDQDRKRFAATRQALRILLGRYTNTDPAALEFTYSQHGKPSLAHPAGDLTFNVAHSGDYAMLALGRQWELGVDLEFERREVEIEQLAERFFAPSEYDKLLTRNAVERIQSFFQLWAAKEALLKAVGTGLSTSLSSIEFQRQAEPDKWTITTLAKDLDPSGWQVQSLSSPNGYAAAVAHSDRVQTVIRLEW